ncbi:glucuronosyltransferase [Photobacterium kishitanii]|uniref:glycosyltransferase n=1 Tax=Photobacterium kishitanii TaxID=318456 RepID=UPI000D1606B4|nr:glycosyltransferase [Photobacterium kishitanii]PSW60628.1 glucuronosyltransferase [Photobacterium kishitanii]
MNELVSVYLPTYNRAELLERAINSVLSQTYKNIEIVVCSDNSTDNTDQLMAFFCDKYENIKYIKNIKNMGACITRNNAIKLCSGYFITGLDDDDYFLPERIENFMLLSRVDRDLVLFSNCVVESKKKTIKKTYDITVDNVEVYKRNSIGNQVFCSKKTLFESGLFDPELLMWQDKDLWIRVIDKNLIAVNSCKYDYVMDVSHDYDRISNVSELKLFNTVLSFISKYPKYKKMSSYLFVSALGYNKLDIRFTDIISLFFNVDKKAKLSIVKILLKRVLR